MAQNSGYVHLLLKSRHLQVRQVS